MRALVIGGGIGGFSAALCLHQQGIEVEVFEQADGIRELGVVVGAPNLPCSSAHAPRTAAGTFGSSGRKRCLSDAGSSR
jgi:2-polyprenyl-6-methoxyphenol hydroxylase-like FAD-dependent oxidoreductase